MVERMHDWRRRVAELEASGLSRAAFCRRHRINYQTMTSWVKRLRDERRPGRPKTEQAPRASGAAGFVEVAVAGSIGATSYEVVLGDHRSIRVGADFDGEVLARLIRIVTSC